MKTRMQTTLWNKIHDRVEKDGLNLRAITLGLNVQTCAAGSGRRTAERLRDHIRRSAGGLIDAVDWAAERYGLPITNKRIATTPITLLAGRGSDLPDLARAMDGAVSDLNDDRIGKEGITFIGGYTALAAKGLTAVDRAFLDLNQA